MPLVRVDTSVTDPIAELEAKGLIWTERDSKSIVPRPTVKFYKELEELSKSGEFDTCDLPKAVYRIMSKYEPSDAEGYSIYMLMALANSSEPVEWDDNLINPSMMLNEGGVTSLIEILSSAGSKQFFILR
ncbi:MAG: hypothetical protein ACE5KA_09390 [Nitrososphaerales archaeon]